MPGDSIAAVKRSQETAVRGAALQEHRSPRTRLFFSCFALAGLDEGKARELTSAELDALRCASVAPPAEAEAPSQ